ncbi:hypothetical protein Tco_0706570 [Tanacetum coccineum]|uniref:Uncharacterized protein n=1 Tax=Tanacetum coccineum TaxID=301880 RepID=A0ABQ4Y7F3_9ASTR
MWLTISTIIIHIQYHLHSPIPTPIPASTPTPIPETDPEPMEHTFEEPSPCTPTHSEDSHHPHKMHAQRTDTFVRRWKEAGKVFLKKEKFGHIQDLKGRTKGSGRKIQDESSSFFVSTVSGQVSTDSIKKSIPSPDKGQREGKAPMIIEEAPKKTKEQILQEEASLAEAIRLDNLEKEEVAKQHYTDKDWDLIRAKIEANAELSNIVLGSGLQGEDFAKKMVELVNQRKKHFAEERARAKRNKPLTQSQLRTYMMNYLKNQGLEALQLKIKCFEEVKIRIR